MCLNSLCSNKYKENFTYFWLKHYNKIMKTNILNKINANRNLFFIAIATTGFLASCTPKTPVVMTPKEITPEYLAQGKTIYENACKRCHDLPNPTDHSAQDWVGIMNSMAPKARLNADQHQMVYDYVVSVKK